MSNRFAGHRSRAVVATALVLVTLAACSAEQPTAIAGSNQLALSLDRKSVV